MSERTGNTGLNEKAHQRLPSAALSVPFRKTPMIISEPDDVTFHPPEKKRMMHGLRRIKGVFVCWLGEEEAYGIRFLFVPVFSDAGVITYFFLTDEPSWGHLLLFTALFAGLAFVFRRIRALSLLFIFLLFSVIGALCAKGESARVATVMIGNEVSTLMTGRIMALEEIESGGYRLVLDIVATERPALQHAPVRVRLTSRWLPQGAAIGTGLKGFVRLRPPSGPVRPGVYDFGFHNYYRGIGAQGYFMGEPASVAVHAPDSLLARLEIKVANLRSFMTWRITSAIPGEAGAVSAALITGQRGGISRATNDALRLSGLAHILSISGLHMAMVTGMVLVIVRAVLGLFPRFSSYYPPRKIAAVIALFISGFYLMLSGADVAAQRSFVMVAVMLLAILSDCAAITMRNLAIAALITVFVVPHEILGPSFQMSFAATAALVAAFGWWSEHRRRKGRNKAGGNRSLFFALIVVPLVSTGVSSLVAGMASGLFAAFHFNNTAPLGILSNALAFPVISVGVMPFALLAAVLMPVHLDWLPLQVMGAGVTLVQKIALWVASISPEVNPGAIPPASLAMLTAGLVLLVYLRSPLKYASLLLLGCGLFLYILAPLPLALISENGRLASIVHDDGMLAINSKRPPAFIIRNWKAAFHVKEVIGPQPMDADIPDRVFRCKDNYCHARLDDGKIFTIAMMASSREKACESGDIVFLNFVGRDAFCSGKITITPEQLALYGTAEIRASPKGPEIIWASGSPSRPWNRHRRFSKTARGMP